jgi:glycosyltransferase involved in cell wall biosynthesis
VPQLLDAFAAFRGTAEGGGSLLVVLGDRHEIANAMLRERGLTEGSLVTGFVSEQEKWDYLVNAVAVLYPSSYEGFGLVAAEAFAAGVPVVSGTGGALREVGGGGAIFVDPTSVGSIVQGLRSACDPAVRARHVANGYKQLEVLRQRSEGYARLVSRLWPVGPDQDHQRAGRISR